MPALAVLLFSGQAKAGLQNPPLIKFREIATLGPSGGTGYVAEAHLAVSNSHVFIAFNQDSGSGMQGYAVKDKSAGTWIEGELRVSGGIDPAVAYNAAGNRFLIVEKLGAAAKVTRYNPNTSNLLVPASAINADVGGILDKTWIMRGQNDAWRQEFYVTCHVFAGPSKWGRTLDGGKTWTQGDLPVSSVFGISPSVALPTSSSPLYAAWTDPGSPATYEFLVGTDNGTLVDFVSLPTPAGTPINIPQTCDPNCNGDAPGPFPVRPSPHLQADPTNVDRLYLVYMGRNPLDPADLDIFCVRIERSAGTWTAGAPVRVNDDVNPLGEHSDQILPDLAVDAAGRLHVVFYDDRNYAQQDTWQDAKYDVYYAYSLDAGQTFTNIKLAADPNSPNPNQPALDHSLTSVADVVPKEYPGISTFGNEVWISFAGTYDLDTTIDKSVIWATQIIFQ
jgi:hypothetical protein